MSSNKPDSGGLHEELSRLEPVHLPTDRSFGLTMGGAFATLFLVIGLFAARWYLSLLALGAAFSIAALLFPGILHGVNRLWMALGRLLHRFMNPVILGAMFAFITLIGLLWRIGKRNPLHLKAEPAAASYWIARRPPAPNPRHFPFQF